MRKAVNHVLTPLSFLAAISLAWLMAAGCENGPPAPAETVSSLPEDLAIDFEPATVGTLSGQVKWEGPIPQVPPVVTRPCSVAMEGLREKLVRDNPNAPDIDPQSRAVRGAVVYLRGVDRHRSRPWDLPPVRVELRDRRVHVLQGEADSSVGFVRRGDQVELTSREALFHSLHFRGPSFFGVSLPDADIRIKRRLGANGLVEVSSGAGYYWMRGYLFVDDHPYYARTDARGHFAFNQVPPGCYDVVCWLPNWHEERHERDPDTCLISRFIFQPAVELVQTVELRPSESGIINFALSEIDFAP